MRAGVARDTPGVGHQRMTWKTRKGTVLKRSTARLGGPVSNAAVCGLARVAVER